MTDATKERLFGWEHAFDHPVTTGATLGVVAAIVVAWILIYLLGKLGRLAPSTRTELNQRMATWSILAPVMIGPILLGAAWTMAAVSVLSILCYREYARATGLFRSPGISLVFMIGFIAVTFSIVDHWYYFFSAQPALGFILIASMSVLADQPKGYIQRVALGCFGFLLFAICLGHLGYLANDSHYRPIILLLLISVELNDVFAYMAGKSFGKRKLAPRTSPGKTIGGTLGALIGTTTLVAMMGHWVFAGDPMEDWGKLIGLGLIVSVAGQLGDLVLSSIKRDLGIKDLGHTLPGHGGLLDRFDSLVLVAPAFFHYVGYFRGFGLDQPTRILSGG